MKTKLPAVVALVSALLAGPSSARARDLNQLISSLYGGDGITLGAGNHVAHFQQETGNALSDLNEKLGSDFGAFPFNSSAGSFSFAFDSDLGTFVSTTDTLGPIFAERAATLGRGKWSANVYGTFFKYDTFNGKSMHDLHVRALHDRDSIGDPNQPEEYEFDMLDIKVDVDASVWLISPAISYGITDNLDVSLLVPIVSVEMDVQSDYRLLVSPKNSTPTVHNTNVLAGAEPSHDRARGSATGLGDIVLGAKYRFWKNDVVDLAAATLVKLETGDEDNFLGSGDTTVRPFLVASRTFRGVLWEKLAVTPHVNIGYEFNTSDTDRNAFKYIAGFDAGTQRLTLASELIGSHGNSSEDRVDLAIGLKWTVYKQWTLAGNVILPLNNEGLRSDVITTLGAGITF